MGYMLVVMGILRAHPGKTLGCAQVAEDRRLSWERFQLRLQ
jgi:hypothetical protein